MKAQFVKVSNQPLRSFSVRRDIVSYFFNKYHYHPENELLLIEKGTGTQFVGDSIQRFQDGDLLFIGSNCPHYLRSDDNYFQGDENLKASALVIHFNSELFGRAFMNLHENRFVSTIMDESKKGCRILGETKKIVIQKMNEILEHKNTNQVLQLFQILDILAGSKEIEFLSTSLLETSTNEKEADRLNLIYNYSIKHFKRKITINEIAGLVSLSPLSFCRYFKAKTRKNYISFLNEIRVEYACKLIKENKFLVTQICYESGFNNFTNFNKAFKKVTNKTPFQFAKEFN
jgi:YesN/AraC family two-component response regulator